MESVLIGGFSLVVLSDILVKVAKQLGLPSRWLPISAVVFGIGLGVAAHYLSEVALFDSIIFGLVAGAASAGFYDLGKK